MQQVAKYLLNKKRQSSLRTLLILSSLSLVGIVALSGLNSQQVKALEAESVMVERLSYSQVGSFPVENFQAYTSPFGYRRSPRGGSRMQFHQGLDIAAPEGSYIRNWWSGKVVKVSDNTACGTAITIQSGDWKHVYCHMKGRAGTGSKGRYIIDRAGGIQIWEGQQIPSGARIGRVGMTGRTTGPHLHWGVKYQDKYIDPALVLRAMYSKQKRLGIGG